MQQQSPENLLFRLVPDDEQWVREIFRALAERGFPPQGQSPHITVTYAQKLDAEVIEQGAQLHQFLPATFERTGVVVFGTRAKQTVAWALEADPALEEAAARVDAHNPEGRAGRWIPHLTMGLRIPRQVVGSYIDALNELTMGRDRTLVAQRLVYRRPQLDLEEIITFD